MATRIDTANLLAQAFESDLAQGLQAILNRGDLQDQQTLNRLAYYVLNLKNAGGTSVAVVGGPPTKKRKAEDGDVALDVSGAGLFSYQDISFSVPVRKKLKLEGVSGGLRALDAAGDIPVSITWDQINHVFCLPVPDRAKPQKNFVVLPATESQNIEPLVWTAPEPNPKGPPGQPTADSMAEQLNSQLAKYGKQIEYPDEDEFVSAAKRPGPVGKQFGIRAHRGSKEGHLFFLAPGILWAFKKPLLFLPFHNITSISYTSVLQRTFNLSIAALEPGTENEIEIEFSMVDQEDFGGIDAYVKRHGLNDASLADNRRAKVYNVNAPKKNATAGAENGVPQSNGAVADGPEGETEIQRVERMLQDAEDEDEEDYVEEEDEDYDEDDDDDSEEGDADEEMEDDEGGGEDGHEHEGDDDE